MSVTAVEGVEIRGSVDGRASEILSPEALQFVATLQSEFGPTGEELLRARAEQQKRLDVGELPDFLADARAIRERD